MYPGRKICRHEAPKGQFELVFHSNKHKDFFIKSIKMSEKTI